MTSGEGWGPGGQGSFFQVLGIIYLIRRARKRRQERRERAAAREAGNADQR